MSTNFPGALDDTTVLENDKTDGSLRAGNLKDFQNNAADAILALEAKVGIDGSAVASSLDKLVKSAADPGHTHTAYSGTGHNHDAAYIAQAIVDAKGDIVAASAADTPARLAVGANDAILMADSGQATGLKWAAPGTPGTASFGASPAEGTADSYARSDHAHGMPAEPAGQNDPTLFLVNGVDYALTRPGIAAALTAADAVDGTVRLCGDVTLDGTSLAVPSNVTLDLGGHELKAPASGSTNLITITGTLGAAVDLGSNATMGAKTVVLTGGGGASFSVGDVVRIFEETSRYFAQVSEIRGISTDTLTLADTVKHGFTTANGTKVRKVTPVSGARVVNGRLNANGNADTTRGILGSYCIDSEVSGVSAVGFPEAAVHFETGLRNRFQKLTTERCGSLSEAALMLFRQTDYRVTDCFDHESTGFAMTSGSGANGQWIGCSAVDQLYRGIKVQYEGWTSFESCRADGARTNLYVGFMFSLFSHDLLVDNCVSQGNEEYGFTVDACDRVKLIGCKGQGNGTGDFVVDDVDGACTDIQIVACDFGVIVNSLAVDVLHIESTKRRDFQDAAANPTKNGQLQRNGNSLLYYNGTTAVDLTTGPSHGHASHTDRTRVIPLTPICDVSTSPPTALAFKDDAHGGLATVAYHMDETDANATPPKYAMATIPVPKDFASGAKVNSRWSSPAASGNGVLHCSVFESLDGFSAVTTLCNSGTSNEGVIVSATSGADKMNTTTFPFGVQPTVGRFMHIVVWRESNHASDTLNTTSSFWFADFEYTADM